MSDEGIDVDEWTPEEIEKINCEMANDCLMMVRETLEGLGEEMSATPAMFYPEAIMSVVCKLRAESDRFRAEVAELRAELAEWQAAAAATLATVEAAVNES